MIQRKGYSLNFSLISNFVIAITINEHYCYYYSTNTIAIIIVSIGWNQVLKTISLIATIIYSYLGMENQDYSIIALIYPI